ncbi:LytR cell envelope-related transcriptional attenuator [Kribbella amoyensis]|uniref:LytR cell envelope-related transcriptional attenuator n=1 Tax=Kribbella amoyensis TaxID=996641 RepID=A0A561BSG3_9ACTN|nr:LytR C-terminal domain-containing protein [Kribbella amoyensis]TWD81811.1 LytR cell envelope-related transcriptional attenuator [Kribbella amoyensis]
MNRSTDERGQVLSSFVAVLAVVAIVGGLLVLFGTRGDDSAAEPAARTSTPAPTQPPATTPSSTPTDAPTSAPTTEPSTEPTGAPTSVPATEPTSAPTDPATTEPTGVPTQKSTLPPSQRPAVEVYNNTKRKGLAEDVGNRARQAGWTVSGADNWHGKIVGSTVYYPAGMQAEAGQLAQDLGLDRIKEALSNMKKDRLTVILTSDYSG